MNRLERLFKTIDEAYEEQGDHGFDPIPFVKEYLAERDAAVIGKDDRITDHDRNRVRLHPRSLSTRNVYERGAVNFEHGKQRQRAQQFDNEEVGA